MREIKGKLRVNRSQDQSVASSEEEREQSLDGNSLDSNFK
jgi:hypothetical protein